MADLFFVFILPLLRFNPHKIIQFYDQKLRILLVSNHFSLTFLISTHWFVVICLKKLSMHSCVTWHIQYPTDIKGLLLRVLQFVWSFLCQLYGFLISVLGNARIRTVNEFMELYNKSRQINCNNYGSHLFLGINPSKHRFLYVLGIISRNLLLRSLVDHFQCVPTTSTSPYILESWGIEPQSI